jgi:hypothetical protein
MNPTTQDMINDLRLRIIALEYRLDAILGTLRDMTGHIECTGGYEDAPDIATNAFDFNAYWAQRRKAK